VRTDSGSEAECIAAGQAERELRALRNFLSTLSLAHTSPSPLFVDNTAAIAMAQGEGSHKRRRHIDIKHHSSREQVLNGTISVSVPTKEQHHQAACTAQTSSDGPRAQLPHHKREQGDEGSALFVCSNCNPFYREIHHKSIQPVKHCHFPLICNRDRSTTRQRDRGVARCAGEQAARGHRTFPSLLFNRSRAPFTRVHFHPFLPSQLARLRCSSYLSVLFFPFLSFLCPVRTHAIAC
jgi:hypothetical protein